MCNTACDSFQEIPIQRFSGNRLMGLLLPLSSGLSGKRKDCWMLGKQTEHMDGEQAKNCYKKCSLHFQHICICIFHFPMLLDPKALHRLGISQTRKNWSWTSDAMRTKGSNPSKPKSTDAQWIAADWTGKKKGGLKFIWTKRKAESNFIHILRIQV